MRCLTLPARKAFRSYALCCSLFSVSIALTVLSFRARPLQAMDTAAPVDAASAASENGGVTASQIQERAMPLLAQLSPHHGTVMIWSGTSEKADGGTQRQWCVRSVAAARAKSRDEAENELAEVRYDADTGALIYAGIICSRDRSGSRVSITAKEAVQQARAWMPKLGLSPSGSVLPVLFPPERTPRGLWRVWLPGQETTGGHPLTVQVTLIAATGDFLYAAVAEHSTTPRTFRPHSLSPSAAERTPLLF